MSRANMSPGSGLILKSDDSTLDVAAVLEALQTALQELNGWETVVIVDDDDNDSNKPFTVPEGYEWMIQAVHITYVSTATVGNRSLALRMATADGDIIAEQLAGAVQAASLTRYYTGAPGAPNELVFGGPLSNRIMFNVPQVVLPEGTVITVLDLAIVDVAADDMHITLTVRRRAVA